MVAAMELAPLDPLHDRQLVAELWERLGNTQNLVEPFGVGVYPVILGRPDAHEWWSRFESVNDPLAVTANLFRAAAAAPEATAEAMLAGPALPVLPETLAVTLMGNPLVFDADLAGSWARACCEFTGSWGQAEPGVLLWELLNRLIRVRSASGRYGRLLGRPAKAAPRHRGHHEPVCSARSLFPAGRRRLGPRVVP